MYRAMTYGTTTSTRGSDVLSMVLVTADLNEALIEFVAAIYDSFLASECVGMTLPMTRPLAVNSGEMYRLARTLTMLRTRKPFTITWNIIQLMASSARNTITRC